MKMESNASFSDSCQVDESLPRPSQVILACLHSICCVFAVGGNILVLLAVYKTRSLRNISMYFLASLSLADLLVGLTMNPLYILVLVFYNYSDADLPPDFYSALMKIENFCWVSTLTATTLSLCAVSIDRFIAVTFSLRYRELVTSRRCVVSIGSIWLFSFAFAMTLIFLGDHRGTRRIFFVICCVIAVVMPFLVILFCNIKLAIAATRHVRIIHENSVHSNSTELRTAPTTRFRESAKNKKATITAIIVSGLFFTLFFPLLVIYGLLLTSTNVDCHLDAQLQIVWLWVAIVSFLHSAFNPWIYCIRSREFRRAIRKQLLC